jgi:hypothetical protein
MALYTLTKKAHDEGIDGVVEKLDRSVKAMVGRVKGLIHAEVTLNLAQDSPRDLLFYSEFERAEDIPPYLESAVHRAHANMADAYVENKEGVDAKA